VIGQRPYRTYGPYNVSRATVSTS